MANFTPDFLQELRDRLQLSGYVARRVQLRRNGQESSGLCPFHNEKTPSFTVNDSKGFYHCFGCGAHGSIIDWAMQTEGLTFPEAVRRLAADANLELPAERPEDKVAAARRQSLHDVLEAGCAWYQNQLAGDDGQAARAYLAGRGLDQATVAAFRLGFAPDRRGALRAALGAAGIDNEQLVAAGLMKRPEGGGALRDYFFDRIMFPISDQRGRVVGFGGRALGDSPAKYLNSPDTDVFHKGDLLYNLANARDAARKAGTVIAVEGYMDVIALHRAGMSHAVAPLGTAMTERQLALIWRMADEPVLCFDGDTAGVRAAARAAERALPLLVAGKSLRFVSLPPGEDPDSMLATAGPGGLVHALGRTRPLVDLVWDSTRAAHRTDTPEQRAAFQADLRKQAQRIADPAVRRHYDTMLRDRFFAAVRVRRQFPANKRPPRHMPRVRDGEHLERVRLHDLRAALAVCINHPEIGESLCEPLSAVHITDTELARLRDALVAWFSQQSAAASDSPIDRTALENHLTNCGLQRIVDNLLGTATRVPYPFAWRDATAEDARRGLTTYFHGRDAAEVGLDKERSKADLRADLSPPALRRTERLAAQERQARALGDGIAQDPVSGGD